MSDPSPVVIVPTYPGSVPLNGQSLSTPAGGGGALQNWAAADEPQKVAAFFAQRFGAIAAGPVPGAPITPYAWHLSAPNGGEHHVEVWPADGAYPFRDDVAFPPPPGARTVVHQSSYFRGTRHSPPEALAVAPTRWAPPPAAWLLALALIVGVGVLWHFLAA